MDGESIIVGIGALGIGAVALFSGGVDSAGDLLNGGNQVKEMRQENALENVLLQTKADGLNKQSEIALQRYQNGCELYLVRAEVQRPEDLARGAMTVSYRRVNEGDSPRDWNGQYYSPGTVVCDNNGGTGIINDEFMVVDYAYTGENVDQFVQAFFASRGWD